MDYFYKYLKYKNKYLFLKNQLGGNFPSWWNNVLSEASSILKEAQSLETMFTFVICGSTAIIFYLNELLTKYNNILTKEELEKLKEIISNIKKPEDLDIFYPRNNLEPQGLFYEKIEELKNAQPFKNFGKTKISLNVVNVESNIDTDIENCPVYIDITVFRECISTINKDALFEKRSGQESLFSKVDFKDLKYRTKESPYLFSNINDNKVLGLNNLIELYRFNEELKIDNKKLEILEFIKSCISKNNDLIKIFN